MDTEIHGNQLILRSWRTQDASWYVESRDDEVFKWTKEDRYLTVEATEQAEIMYWLAPWGRGFGIATRAVDLLCEWAFAELLVERIELKTLPGNVRSQRVAERAGFHLRADQTVKEAGEYAWFERSAS